MGGLVNKMIFQPPPSTYTSDVQDLIWLTTEPSPEPVPAFFVSYPGATFTVLFSHGNAEDLGCIFDWLHEMSYHLKVNVLAYDYAGYGQCGGEPSEEAAYAAIDAAFEYLTEQMGFEPKHIIACGRSLGGGPSCELAMKTPDLGGLILQCTFTSVLRVIFGPDRKANIPGDIFCNVHKLPHIKCPVLVAHGRRDEVIPFHHGELLAAAAVNSTEPMWICEAGHNNIEIYWKLSFLNRIGSFIKDIQSQQELLAIAAVPVEEVVDVLAERIRQKNRELHGLQQLLLNTPKEEREDVATKVDKLEADVRVLEAERNLNRALETQAAVAEMSIEAVAPA